MGRKIYQFCKLTVGCLVIFAFSNNSFTSELDEIINANKANPTTIIKKIDCCLIFPNMAILIRFINSKV